MPARAGPRQRGILASETRASPACESHAGAILTFGGESPSLACEAVTLAWTSSSAWARASLTRGRAVPNDQAMCASSNEQATADCREKRKKYCINSTFKAARRVRGSPRARQRQPGQDPGAWTLEPGPDRTTVRHSHTSQTGRRVPRRTVSPVSTFLIPRSLD